MNLGVTSLAAPNAASSSTARYSPTARLAAGGRPLAPSTPFCRFAFRLDQAGIDRKVFPADQALTDAAPQNCLKHAPQQVTLTKAAMSVEPEPGAAA